MFADQVWGRGPSFLKKARVKLDWKLSFLYSIALYWEPHNSGLERVRRPQVLYQYLLSL